MVLIKYINRIIPWVLTRAWKTPYHNDIENKILFLCYIQWLDWLVPFYILHFIDQLYTFKMQYCSLSLLTAIFVMVNMLETTHIQTMLKGICCVTLLRRLQYSFMLVMIGSVNKCNLPNFILMCWLTTNLQEKLK